MRAKREKEGNRRNALSHHIDSIESECIRGRVVLSMFVRVIYPHLQVATVTVTVTQMDVVHSHSHRGGFS